MSVEKLKQRFFVRTDDPELDGSTPSKRIYKAYDTDEGVEVAMHVIRCADPSNPRYRPLALKHDNIVFVSASWAADGAVTYVTPMVSAGTLQGYIARIDDVRHRVARKWCRQILAALSFMHAAGQTHGDLRLSNIFINGETGNVLLGSFVQQPLLDVAAALEASRAGGGGGGGAGGTDGVDSEDLSATLQRALRYAPPEFDPAAPQAPSQGGRGVGHSAGVTRRPS